MERGGPLYFVFVRLHNKAVELQKTMLRYVPARMLFTGCEVWCTASRLPLPATARDTSQDILKNNVREKHTHFSLTRFHSRDAYLLRFRDLSLFTSRYSNPSL